jgi:diadenosine tetraphosphate (Ap4A) HIT family hydrolase
MKQRKMPENLSLECELCCEISGHESRFTKLYLGHIQSRILLETDNFLVVPSLGQIGDAHMMIMSRHHETATANINDENRRELLKLLEKLRAWFRLAFGNKYIIFENGDPLGCGQMGCSIGHLHVHVLGSHRLPDDLRGLFVDFGGQSQQAGFHISGVAGPYSYVEFPTGDALMIDRRLPSQTLRKTIAGVIGLPRWDWRECGTEIRLIKLVQRRFSAAIDYV